MGAASRVNRVSPSRAKNGHKALEIKKRTGTVPQVNRVSPSRAKNGHKALDYVKRESMRPELQEEDGHRSTSQWAMTCVGKERAQGP